MFTEAIKRLQACQIQICASHDSVEIPFLAAVFEALFEKVSAVCFQGFRWRIYSIHHSDPEPVSPNDLVVLIGNEDGHVPENVLRAHRVFTPYLANWPPASHVDVIPLGYHGKLPSLPCLPLIERKVNVSFAGQVDGSRQNFIMHGINFLGQIKHEDKYKAQLTFTPRFQSGLSAQHYAELLQNTQIILAPWGRAPITFRFFEALRAGCVVLTPPLPPYPYLKVFPGLYVAKDWSNLSTVLFASLKHPEVLIQLQQDSLAYYRNTCSPEAVAQQLLRALKSSEYASQR